MYAICLGDRASKNGEVGNVEHNEWSEISKDIVKCLTDFIMYPHRLIC